MPTRYIRYDETLLFTDFPNDTNVDVHMEYMNDDRSTIGKQ